MMKTGLRKPSVVAPLVLDGSWKVLADADVNACTTMTITKTANMKAAPVAAVVFALKDLAAKAVAAVALAATAMTERRARESARGR